MKSFLVDRKITTIEQIQVEMDEIQESDVMHMNSGQLKSFACEAVQLLAKRGIIKDDPSIEINHNPQQASIPVAEPSPAGQPDIDGMVGVKRGHTSRYHYVYFARKPNKYISSVTIKGKKIIVGAFDDEDHAAHIIDTYLDRINDQKRPRNRDEFEEIQSLYLQNNKDIA